MKKLLREHATSDIRCYDSENFERVQSHLAVTPSEMNQMRERGIPISSHLEEKMFYDGDSSPVVIIDPMLMRGVDINDAWNAEQSSKNNLAKANLKDIKTYGK